MRLHRRRWTAVTADVRPALAIVMLAALLGVIASRFIDPVYLARTTLWVEKGNAVEQLLRPAVMDSAVKTAALYLSPGADADPDLLTGFELRQRFVPGHFTLSVNPDGTRWYLAAEEVNFTDSGNVGDSIGTKMGFTWLPAAAVLRRRANTEQHFTVASPRAAAAELRLKLTAVQPRGSRFVSLSLADESPARAARALNAISTRYVALAQVRGQGPVIVLDSAVVPAAPARNSPRQVVARSILVGIGIGLCLILIQVVRGNGVPAGADEIPPTDDHSVPVT